MTSYHDLQGIVAEQNTLIELDGTLIDGLTNTIKQLEAELRTAKINLGVKENIQETLIEERDRAKKERDQLFGDIKEMQEMVDTAIRERDAHRETIKKMPETEETKALYQSGITFNAYRARDKANKDRDDMKRSYDALTTTLEQQDKTVREQQADLQNAQKLIDSLFTDIAGKEDTIRLYRYANAHLRANDGDTQGFTRAEMQREIEDLNKQVLRLNERLNGRNTIIDDLNATLAQKNDSTTRLHSKINDLETAAKERSEYIVHLQKRIKRVNNTNQEYAKTIFALEGKVIHAGVRKDVMGNAIKERDQYKRHIQILKAKIEQKFTPFGAVLTTLWLDEKLEQENDALKARVQELEATLENTNDTK